jgi:hypothetical protein
VMKENVNLIMASEQTIIDNKKEARKWM